MPKISVALATYNEEENIGSCLESVRDLADEIVVVDGTSVDKTREIAKSFGARVIKADNPPIFHINKQKALDAATGDWILQLDADERVTSQLSEEIKQVVKMTDEQIRKRSINPAQKRLFERHQRLVEEKDGRIGKSTGEIVAFFVPRKNYFLGKPMAYAGTYPDGVIRLAKRGKAYFPAKSVHEQIKMDGEVAWLESDLIHLANPTLSEYMEGAGGYTDLLSDELRIKGVKLNPFLTIYYLTIKPFLTFLLLFIRHKGFLDGIYGFLFSLFSALHFPVAVVKLWTRK